VRRVMATALLKAPPLGCRTRLIHLRKSSNRSEAEPQSRDEIKRWNRKEIAPVAPTD
jgi:hypothetical protein